MTRDEAIAVLQEEIDGNLELTIREWRERDEQRLFPALRMAIEALKTLEAAEKLRTEVLPHSERKQGKWITCHDVDKHTDVYECNQCRFVNWFPSTFCPDCGSKMERRPK